ncbi:MAG TPA: metal ABC transporter ATP-binding protein [Phycisphaerales bacterium]|nr:metal ABC transporter ATP-binding protein [Phycisphaerales bacterium]
MTAFAVKLESVSYTYPGSPSPAIEGVNLDVPEGTRLGILGPNGGGKSTLLKIALGLLRPSVGHASIFGQDPADARRAGLIGYVPQRVEALLGFPMSVRQIVTLGASWRLAPWKPVPAATRTTVEDALRLTGAGAFAEKPIGSLSGGQMQRAMIARALAARPRILALDEPLVGIDAAGQQQFGDLLASIHRSLGVTILIISHDLRAIAAGSDRVACLARRLHSHVSPEGLTPQVLAELFSHDLVGIAGLTGPVHVHAHPAGECCEHHQGDSPRSSHAPGQAGDVTVGIEGEENRHGR